MSLATIYSVVWNEELRMPYFVRHYRSRFPDCPIVLFDNKSTDKTLKIALDNNCTIVSFDTNGKIRDDIIKINKNEGWRQWHISTNPWNCWHHWTWTGENEKLYLAKYPDVKNAVDQGKFNCGMTHFFNNGSQEGRIVPNRPSSSTVECKTDWCIVVDMDEFLDVDEKLLSKANFNIAKSTIFDMYGENNNIDLMDKGVMHGFKTLCWNTKEVSTINYGEGAHDCAPSPIYGKTVKFNTAPIYTYHMKWVSYEYVINRYRIFIPKNIDNRNRGWGSHIHFSEPRQLQYYITLKENAVKVRPSPDVVRNEQ